MYCNILGVLYFDPAYLKTCITCIFLHIYIQYITIPTQTYSTCIHSCTYLDEHNKFPWIASSSLSVSLPEYAFSVWSMLLLKCVWVWIFYASNSSRQRLSGGKGNFNKSECNMWSQVCPWSIRASEPIQHLNLPPPPLTRPHQCQPLLSHPLSAVSLLTDRHWCRSTLSFTHVRKKTPKQLWMSWHGPSSECKPLDIIYQVFIIPLGKDK